MSGSGATTAVALLALPESSASVLYGLYDVLRSVGGAWASLTGETPRHGGFSVRIVSQSRAPFECDGGVPVAPHAAFDDGRRFDVAVVSDLAIDESAPRDHWRPSVAWLRDQYAAGATLCSVCTGSLLLAASGLLDGQVATTHWAARRLFEVDFPDVRLEADRILVPAGEGHRLITAGGGAAWEELSLYLTRRYCGEAAAVQTAKLFLIGDRSDGQRPYTAMTPIRPMQDAAIAECQAWIARHYAVPNPVTRMVERSGMPERTFKRRFRSATGYAPVAYVQALRIEQAKSLLESSGLPTGEVAARVGYEDPASFRRLFKKVVGLTPARYRLRFRRVGLADDAPPAEAAGWREA